MLSTLPLVLRQPLVRTVKAALRLGRPTVSVAPGWRVVWLGDPEHETFFGYYDHSPVAADDGLLLACRRPRSDGPHAAGTPLTLGTYDWGAAREGGNPPFRPFATTTTWCWQQGARLLWDPRAPGRRALFNRLVDGRHGVAMVDVDSGAEVAALPHPVYDLSPDGRTGLTLNFARLQRLRPGYGYDDLPDPTAGEAAPAADGISALDLESGATRFLVSLRELAETAPQPSMAGAEHYVNHLSWNPAGSRFLVYHLWVKDGRRHVRSLTFAADGSDKRVLSNSGIVSHYGWLDEAILVQVAGLDGRSLRYRLFHDGDGAEGGEGAEISAAAPTVDGHPSLSPDGRRLLTDTYPDRRQERRLLVVDLDSHRQHPIGTFFSPPAHSGEHRCDLHPRWAPDGGVVVFDSGHAGYRQMGVAMPTGGAR